MKDTTKKVGPTKMSKVNLELMNELFCEGFPAGLTYGMMTEIYGRNVELTEICSHHQDFLLAKKSLDK